MKFFKTSKNKAGVLVKDSITKDPFLVRIEKVNEIFSKLLVISSDIVVYEAYEKVINFIIEEEK